MLQNQYLLRQFFFKLNPREPWLNSISFIKGIAVIVALLLYLYHRGIWVYAMTAYRYML